MKSSGLFVRRDELEEGPEDDAAEADDQNQRNDRLQEQHRRRTTASLRACSCRAPAMANRIGATRRSWNRRAEKLARPAAVFRRFCSARTGITMAVDDRARASADDGCRGDRVDRP